MILSILDIKRQIKIYIISSITCLLFGIIYELFSHRVYSMYMIFAFLVPLVMGSIPCIILLKLRKSVSILFIDIYNSCISTFTIYSFIKGFLDIYGTSNSLISIYLIVGFILFILSLIIYNKSN